MATVNKDFKIKSGLVVEGASGTINGYNILTEAQASIDFIVDTIGGTATSTNTADTVVKRDASGDFAAGTITAETGFSGDLTGNVTGNVTGDVTGDLTGNVTGNVTGNLTGDVTGTVSDISNHDTDDLAEGVTNVYFTDARALSAVQSGYESYADQAEADANSYTDSLIGDATVDGTAGNTVKDRIDTAVANLVDAAPAALDTLNELAAALGDDANFVTTITTSIGEKVAKAGDTMTGALTLSGAPTADLHAATKKYVDDAEAAANAYTDGEVSTINTTIGNLTTDDVAEGTNQYFTDERAQDAVASIIAAGTHANITITYDDANGTLSFEAENGVADSTTDDLTEGSTNLYFTNQRAVDALEAVVPNFTEVDVNSVATQVAATQTVATASQVVGYSFDSGTYTSAKFLVKVDTGTHTEVSEVLVTLDSSNNIAITEFAVVGTNGSLSTITAGMNGTDVELLVTTANNNSDVTVSGTLLV